jgi:hypothetical protein
MSVAACHQQLSASSSTAVGSVRLYTGSLPAAAAAFSSMHSSVCGWLLCSAGRYHVYRSSNSSIIGAHVPAANCGRHAVPASSRLRAACSSWQCSDGDRHRVVVLQVMCNFSLWLCNTASAAIHQQQWHQQLALSHGVLVVPVASWCGMHSSRS